MVGKSLRGLSTNDCVHLFADFRNLTATPNFFNAPAELNSLAIMAMAIRNNNSRHYIIYNDAYT